MAELRRKRDRVDALATRTGEPTLEIIELREAKRSPLQLPESTAARDETVTPARRMQ